MSAPRVLVVLDTVSTWSRGVLRGFAKVAHEQGWALLHYHPDADLEWLARAWPVDAAVLGPSTAARFPRQSKRCVTVAVNTDESTRGMASVCPDEERIADLALEHFLSRGFRNLATFRFDESPFAVRREQRFRRGAEGTGLRLGAGWWADGAEPPRTQEDPAAIAAWLRNLAKPCGVFAICDSWARVVARYARESGSRIPEDIALVGVDDDAMECEIVSPPLSSVALPWRTMGASAGELVRQGLRGKPIDGKLVRIAPLEVVTRRSSDTLAVEDPLVLRAITWIFEHAERRVTVPMIARAAGTTRQRLERHFRRALGRSIMQEARRAHVELARRLLATTDLPLLEVARKSGFTNAALLSVAFRREVGVPPGVYRRRTAGRASDD
jgi:LacI family transcriptional regulator